MKLKIKPSTLTRLQIAFMALLVFVSFLVLLVGIVTGNAITISLALGAFLAGAFSIAVMQQTLEQTWTESQVSNGPSLTRSI